MIRLWEIHSFREEEMHVSQQVFRRAQRDSLQVEIERRRKRGMPCSVIVVEAARLSNLDRRRQRGPLPRLSSCARVESSTNSSIAKPNVFARIGRDPLCTQDLTIQQLCDSRRWIILESSSRHPTKF